MRIDRKGFWIFIFLLLLSVNCGKQKAVKMAWKDVRRINQYNIYRQFLVENPNTGHKNDIEQAVDSLKQQWHPKMRDVQSVSFVFEEDLPEGVNFLQSQVQIKRALKEVVEDSGFEFRETDGPADATVKVTIKGNAVAEYYSISMGGLRTGRHYSSAKVSGSIEMIKNNQSLLSENFYGNIPAPSQIGKEYNKISDAPFNEAFLHSNFPAAGHALFSSLLNMQPNITTKHINEDTFFGIPVPDQYPKKLGKKELEEKKNRFRMQFPLDADKASIVENSEIIAAISVDKDALIILNAQTGSLNSWINFEFLKTWPAPLPLILNVEDSTVYLGTWYFSEPDKADGYLHAINGKKGTINWIFKTNGNISTQPWVEQNVVYFGSQDHYFYAVNCHDGTLKWKFKTNKAIGHGSALGNKKVYFVSDNVLYAVDTGNGSLQWKFKIKSDLLCNPKVTDKNVYVCSDQYLYAINPEDGSLNWKFNKPSKNDRLTLDPIIRNNTIYVGHYRLYAVDAESGILKWKFRPDVTLDKLDLQLSINDSDTSICVVTDCSTNYLKDKVNR